MRVVVKKGLSALRQYSRDEAAGDSILQQLNDRLSALKLRAPHRPLKENGKLLAPELPGDITKLSDRDVGRLHSEYAAMCQYVGYHLSLKAIEHAVSKRLDKLTRARVRLEKSGTVDDKAAKVEVDGRVQKSTLKELETNGTEQLTQALFDGFVIGKEVTSREITRRSQLEYGELK